MMCTGVSKPAQMRNESLMVRGKVLLNISPQSLQKEDVPRQKETKNRFFGKTLQKESSPVLCYHKTKWGAKRKVCVLFFRGSANRKRKGGGHYQITRVCTLSKTLLSRFSLLLCWFAVVGQRAEKVLFSTFVFTRTCLQLERFPLPHRIQSQATPTLQQRP